MAINEINQGGAPGREERDPALDRLYREAGGEGPPARLDATLLAAAHREVGARPRARPTLLRRWQVPVSIAAVVVLSVSLVTLVREEGGEQLVQAPPPAPARSPAAPPIQPAPDPAAKPQAQLFRDVPSPAERRAAAPQAVPAEDAAAYAPPAAELSAAPAAAVPAAKPAPSRRMSRARKEAADAGVRPPAWQGYESEPPQKWLDRIADLKRQERVADADAMLAEFKRRFPAHPLPPGLK